MEETKTIESSKRSRKKKLSSWRTSVSWTNGRKSKRKKTRKDQLAILSLTRCESIRPVCARSKISRIQEHPALCLYLLRLRQPRHLKSHIHQMILRTLAWVAAVQNSLSSHQERRIPSRVVNPRLMRATQVVWACPTLNLQMSSKACHELVRAQTSTMKTLRQSHRAISRWIRRCLSSRNSRHWNRCPL